MNVPVRDGADLSDDISRRVIGYIEANSSIVINQEDGLDVNLDKYGMDSLQLIQLVLWIEGEVGKPVDIDGLFMSDEFSIRSISQYIERNA